MKYLVVAATALLLGGCNLSAAQSMIDHAPSCSDSDVLNNLTKQLLDQSKSYISFVGEPTAKIKDVFTISHEQYTATCLATFVLDGTVKVNGDAQVKHTETDVPYTALVSDDGKMNRVGLK